MKHSDTCSGFKRIDIYLGLAWKKNVWKYEVIVLQEKEKGVCKEDVALCTPNIIRKFLLRSWKLLIYYPNNPNWPELKTKYFSKRPQDLIS